MLAPGASEVLIRLWLYLRLVLFICRYRCTHYHPTSSHKLTHTGIPTRYPGPMLSLFLYCKGLLILHKVGVVDCMGGY